MSSRRQRSIQLGGRASMVAADGQTSTWCLATHNHHDDAEQPAQIKEPWSHVWIWRQPVLHISISEPNGTNKTIVLRHQWRPNPESSIGSQLYTHALDTVRVITQGVTMLWIGVSKNSHENKILPFFCICTPIPLKLCYIIFNIYMTWWLLSNI